MHKKYLIIVFILVAFMQIYVPAKMILNVEDILARGKEFKFRTQPVDPNDPFRGKYITLNYKENVLKGEKGNRWTMNETVYVLFSTDESGYARIQSISKVEPKNNPDFVKAEVDYVHYNTNNHTKDVIINYPFTRFYMGESKAARAELSYRESTRDSNQVAYGLVNIKDGEAVLKDVMINGVPIKKIVERQAKPGE